MTFGSLPREASDLCLTSAGVAKSLRGSEMLGGYFASKYGYGLLCYSIKELPESCEVDAVNPFGEVVALYSGQGTVLE